MPNTSAKRTFNTNQRYFRRGRLEGALKVIYKLLLIPVEATELNRYDRVQYGQPVYIRLQ